MSIIKVNNLSFSYDNSDKVIFSNLNLNLDSSWKLGLVGRNGRGKTTFLNLLRNELQSQINFEVWQLERELNLMQLNPDLATI